MNHKVWMRKYMFCADCLMAWFEEVGEEITCICSKEE